VVSAETAINFARTKIQPPHARPDWVARPALEARLGQALAEQTLTLLVAPAGWGKTSALARQCAKLPHEYRVIWLSLDEDDDLPRFLVCLAGALAPLDLPWRVSPTALPTLAQGERGLRAVSTEIINALAEAPVVRGLLVFDDVHRLTDPRTGDLLGQLIERLPAQWGVVIASRSEPALPLSRLRVQQRLTELRQNDLRFGTGEVQALLQAQSRTDVPAAELIARTEGWAAGVQLLLSAGAGTGEPKALSTRYVFDYFADEVLATMPSNLRTFLLRCSVLPELTPARCAQVSGMPDAAVLFEQVERQGLFITALDARHQVLRLHDLFRDFLEARLQRDHADDVPQLLVRAAEGEADVHRAMGWLIRAQAWEGAAQRLLERGSAMVNAGREETVLRFLAQLPGAVLDGQPALHMLCGYCHLSTFDFEAMADAMRRAAEGFAHAGRPVEQAAARVFMHVGQLSSGAVAACREGLAQLRSESFGADVDALVAFYSAWQCYADLEGEALAPHFARAVSCLEQGVASSTWDGLYFHGMFAGLPGMDALMQRFDELASAKLGAQASLMRVSLMHARCTRAMVAGRLADAVGWLASADEDLEWLGSPRAAMTENLLLHLAVDSIRGDVTACEQAYARLMEDMRASSRGNQRAHESSVHVGWASACWLLGKTDALRQAVQALEIARNPDEWAVAARDHALALALGGLAEGDLATTITGLTGLAVPLAPREDSLHTRGGALRLLLVEALRRSGRTQEAAQALKPWLHEVKAGGPVGAALVVGPQVMDALADAAWLTLLDQEEVESLRVARARAAGVASPGNVADRSAPATPAGLSEREAEVLTLVAAGESNKRIARLLDLSPHTVKRHVANIFNKIGITTRTQAATWWMEHKP
jgi:LuxR family transcriptional regulator, maltose regulon positive regulatory protein